DHEQAVGIAHRKGAAGAGGAGAHQHGPSAAIGPRLADHALELEMHAGKIERLVLRPDPLGDNEPFLGVGVAGVVLEHGRAEHVELADVPARYDVKAAAATPDVVGGHHLLGGAHR